MFVPHILLIRCVDPGGGLHLTESEYAPPSFLDNSPGSRVNREELYFLILKA